MKSTTRLLATALMVLFVYPTTSLGANLLLDGTGSTQEVTNASVLGNRFEKSTYPTCDSLPNWVITEVRGTLRGGTVNPTRVDLELSIASSTSKYFLASTTIAEGINSTFGVKTATLAEPFYVRDQCNAYFVAGAASQIFFIEFVAITSGGGTIRGVYGGDELTGYTGYNTSGAVGSEYDFDIYGFDLGAGGDTSTRILTQNSPDIGDTTATNVVVFDFDYYFNDTTHFGILDRACVQITNVSKQQENTGICEDIVGSGPQGFTQADQLLEGNTYTWRPYLTSSTTAEGRIYGDTYYFNVVSAPLNQSVLPPTNATSTSALQSWFVGAQSAIISVPPWSYWVQMRTIMDDGADLLTATSTLPSTFVFQVGATTTPIHVTLNVFAPENVTRLIPESFWDTAKALISFVLWVMFALMVYHEVHRRFSRPHD